MVYRRKKEVYLPGWLWFFLILPLGLLVALLYRQKRLQPIARRLRSLPLPFPSSPRYSEPDSIPLDIRPEIPSPEGLETGAGDFAVVEGRGAPEIILEQPEPTPPAGTPSSTDDLTIIEGIGPKIASLLQEAGIVSFAMLAGTPQEELDEILTSARLRRISDPTTWPDQARLAAAGEWEALQQLQNTLKGGRRASAG
jgi:hypothetical protein